MLGPSINKLLAKINYGGVKTPPVVIVNVEVPEVPTVTGVATKVYEPAENVQVNEKPLLTELQYALLR